MSEKVLRNAKGNPSVRVTVPIGLARVLGFEPGLPVKFELLEKDGEIFLVLRKLEIKPAPPGELGVVEGLATEAGPE